MLDRFGGFMVVDALVKPEPGYTKVINLVHILEVVTNLITAIFILIGACRIYEPENTIRTLQKVAKPVVVYRRGE
jgi:hypothetical protein